MWKILKGQIELLEMKTIMSEIKNTRDGLIADYTLQKRMFMNLNAHNGNYVE